MSAELILTFVDGAGDARRVVVSAPRFFIGRSPDNDLTIADTNLSRRHAVVETLDGLPHISDCGSRNGTSVNGQLIEGPVALRDGDQISLGGSCHLNVALSHTTSPNVWSSTKTPSSASSATTTTPATLAPSTSAPPQANANAPPPAWLKPPLIAALVSSLVILFAAVLLYALTRGRSHVEQVNTESSNADISRADDDERARTRRRETEATNTESDDADNSAVAVEPTRMPPPLSNANANDAADAASSLLTTNEPTARADSDEEIARAVRRVMGRISSDNATYISEGGVRDVAARVRAYRGSTALQEKLRAMARGCSDVSTQARNINLKPPLVMYAALAQSEQGGEPVAVARQMIPKLLTLRATFGTATANSSLLLVAAYPYPFNPSIGSQTRTPHPLYSKLVETGGQRSTVETSVARSVWFLRERGGITNEAYDLVVRLLAIGIIAQSPHQYGINAEPLLC